MIDIGSFLLGMLFAFIASAGIVALIVWHEQRRKRRAAFDQFEHLDSDDRYLAQVSYPPSYWGRGDR